ncbi:MULTISPECIES: DUF2845 domain-containing protein [Microbulbifer]|uniref:DUF2845 domain-containing protein n=1 Tax=Microbulbifer TaxID=48073 RepID=UPI001E5DE861|nr:MULTISPECIES: DUF2845 domain-containing protein [Microbulbifer]UHQ54597.1 DUF2845 domain-containing protein [Microbulbifer sp. YPW16]
MFRQVVVALLLSALAAQASALRCGNRVVQEGDLKIGVLEKCGEPILHEQIGYVDALKTERRVTVLKIDELVYRINGDLLSLVFEGNRLVKIRRGE